MKSPNFKHLKNLHIEVTKQCIFKNFRERGFPDGTMVKNPPANTRDAGDMGLTPGSGRSPGGVNGNPLQYSCLENPTDRGAWWATVHGVAKSQTRLSDFIFTFKAN